MNNPRSNFLADPQPNRSIQVTTPYTFYIIQYPSAASFVGAKGISYTAKANLPLYFSHNQSYTATHYLWRRLAGE